MGEIVVKDNVRYTKKDANRVDIVSAVETKVPVPDTDAWAQAQADEARAELQAELDAKRADAEREIAELRAQAEREIAELREAASTPAPVGEPAAAAAESTAEGDPAEPTEETATKVVEPEVTKVREPDVTKSRGGRAPAQK